MKRTTLVIACLLFWVGSAIAQQQTAAADPLTGRWTGYMGRSETERQPITVELKYDGKTILGTITGPPYPGDISTGTFDPTTGTLEFEVVVRDADKTIVRFDGMVAKGTASGRVAFNNQEGIFRVTKDTAAPTAASTPPTQMVGKRTPEQIQAAYEAHRSDFDYLLGDWEFTAENKEYGKFRGYWSAVRLDSGQILDEYRIVGDKGETFYVTTTLRNYNKALDRWELIGADAGGGLQDFGTGRRIGEEVRIEQQFGVNSGHPTKWRIRYYNIQPDRFSWTGDRSSDGGRTWTKDYQQIEAHRIGAPRSLGPLAPPKTPGTQ